MVEEPAYIQYEEPAYDSVVESTKHEFINAYLKVQGGNTLINVYTLDNSTTNHYRKITMNQAGTWTHLYHNMKC